MGAERNGPSTVLRQTPGEAGAILHRFNCVHLLAAREGQPVEVVDDHTKSGAGLVLLLGDAVDVLQREVAWLARGDRRPGAAVSAACALSPSGLTPWLAQRASCRDRVKPARYCSTDERNQQKKPALHQQRPTRGGPAPAPGVALNDYATQRKLKQGP